MRAPPSTINALSRFATPNSARWTCSSCRNQLLPRVSPASRSYNRQYSSGSGYSAGGNKRNPRDGRTKASLWAATATGTAGVGALAFTDDIKHGYEATERAGRVASTLAICINE